MHGKLARVNRSSITRDAAKLGVAVLALVGVGCAPRARMCTTNTECVADAACVAGRCQSNKPNVKPAVENARRLVMRPVDIAYVRRGAQAGDGALPPLAPLGKDGAAALLLLRFEAALPTTGSLVEAYLILRRSRAVDDDPTPIYLHVNRIVEAWNGRSTSWAFTPQMQESRSPTTVVEPGGPSLVRLDVRELVRNWARHDPRDQGLAVVAETESRTGTTFALQSVHGVDDDPVELSSGRATDSRSMSAPDVEPYLELYVR